MFDQLRFGFISFETISYTIAVFFNEKFLIKSCKKLLFFISALDCIRILFLAVANTKHIYFPL